MEKNAYNTNDPQTLLQLKRLEADALLDILRTINHDELKIAQLCKIARNVLRAQLGAKKVVFYYQADRDWVEGIRLGFDEFSAQADEELFRLHEVTRVDEDLHPALFAATAEYVLPISNRDGAHAFFVVADFADTEVERQSDLIFIETLGSILSVAIRNKQLFQEKMQQEVLVRELEVAETIQKQLLISDFTPFQDFDVHAIHIAHHGVGGDFFDIIEKRRGLTFVCIADVSGKGIGAALLMSNLQANLRALCARYNDLETIIRELNRILYNITVGEKFVTLFLARIDTVRNMLTYINAGHNYPIYTDEPAEYHALDKGCILLGIMPELKIEQERRPIRPGGTLFMFTDGVVEQHNTKDEMYGIEPVLSVLNEEAGRSSHHLIDRIQQNLSDFTGDATVSDDITMMCVKFL
jgi:phosphoserine phosphatase RsbU/P